MTGPASRPVVNYFTRVATEGLRGMARGANRNVWEMGGASGSEWAGQAAGQAVSATYDQKVKAPAMQYMQRTTIPGMVSWWYGAGNEGTRQ